VKVHDLKPNEGAHKRAKRVGRGIGGKGGKTAGRGSKGQKARNNVRLGFEGGQLPLQQRLPKLRGFTNPFRVEYQAVNLDTIADAVSSDADLTEITPEALFERGLIGKEVLVKVLGRGEVTSAVTVKAHAFSKSAEAAITAAGGTVERLPLPFSVRPPSSGNQHMNR
jgi:large subunit ribosomal protein L15